MSSVSSKTSQNRFPVLIQTRFIALSELPLWGLEQGYGWHVFSSSSRDVHLELESGYYYAPSNFLKQVEVDVLFIDTSQIA